MVIDKEVIKAFDLMWGNFPEPVILVHKNKDIVAVNFASVNAGHIPGFKCSKSIPNLSHKCCQADKAIKSGQAKYVKSHKNEKEVIRFWLPLNDYPDYFIHFGIGLTIDYDNMAS